MGRWEDGIILAEDNNDEMEEFVCTYSVYFISTYLIYMYSPTYTVSLNPLCNPI